MPGLRVFCGYDQRQPLAYNVLQHSIVSRCSQPVSCTALKLDTLPLKKRGLTEFTFSRYLVPWLCDYQGQALFLDADMLCLGDVAELFAAADNSAVSVVKVAQRFEWPSLMLFNCEKCIELTPEYIEASQPQGLQWADRIGELPKEWNHIVGYDEMKPAKLVHYTQGLPIWFETAQSDYALEWMNELKDMERTCTWKELMGASVHAKPVLEKLFRGYVQ